MPSSRSSAVAPAPSRLEIEVEELRRDRDRLQREEAVWRSRAELSEKKANRCAQDVEQAQSMALQLERDVLTLKQQNHQTELKLKRSINDLEEQFSIEREALEQALATSERRLEEARTLERQQTLRVAAYEKKLMVVESTPNKKRTRMQEEEEEEEEEESDLVFDLKMRVRELEVENLALSKGVAVTLRTQQLAEELASKDKECRKLADELVMFKSSRKAELEQESDAELLRVQLAALKAKHAALVEFATLKDTILGELEQWKQVLPNSETPQQASEVFSGFQANYAKLSAAKQDLEASTRMLQEENDLLVTKLAASADLVAELERKLGAAEDLARRMEIERDATERVLQSVPLDQTTSEAANEFSHRALEQLREELRIAKSDNERLQREIQASVGSHAAFDPIKTRVLRVKPTQRADKVFAAAAAAAAAQQQKQQALLRTAEKMRSPAAAMMVPQTPEGFSVDKHNARLKEMFQKQIRMFKEAVFLMFGWKIEMTPDDTRPVLKLKSMFAESPDDVLMFRMNTLTSQLDLLGSEYAKTLDPTMLAYLHRFQSPPGFISYLTLELFNRQTRM